MMLNKTTVDFFDYLNKKRKAVTFDDITLEPGPSNIHPNLVNLETNITKKIKLHSCGILSAAMDTVTEQTAALEMAKNGSLGIIHRNLDADTQANMIKWVRNKINSESMIEKPIIFFGTQRLSDIQISIKKNGWTFTNFPIIGRDRKLIGMVSRNEMNFTEDLNPLLKDIMIKLSNLIVCSDDITRQEAYELMKNKKIKKLPVVDKDGKFVGLYTWKDVKKDETKKKLFSLDDEGHFLVGAAIGIGKDEFKRVDKLMKVGCKLLVIDTSHGACTPVVEMLEYIKEKYGDKTEVIVGNIVSYRSAKYLLTQKYKPDALKIGIGSGRICTTRQVTGHGMPQITAIFQVWKAINELDLDIPIIADGGIRESGDIVKALALGASGVMMGGMFAGTDESPGKLVVHNGQKYKIYRGMGSKNAMKERSGSRQRYFNSISKTDNLTEEQLEKTVPEGVEGFTEYKGSIAKVITELTGGVKIGLSHSGAKNIDELRKNASIWLQSNVGINEAKPNNLVKIIN